MGPLEIVLAIVAAVGGLSGISGFVTARKAARKDEVDALTETISALQKENARLRACIEALEQKQIDQGAEVSALKASNSLLRARVEELEAENTRLKRRRNSRQGQAAGQE